MITQLTLPHVMLPHNSNPNYDVALLKFLTIELSLDRWIGRTYDIPPLCPQHHPLRNHRTRRSHRSILGQQTFDAICSGGVVGVFGERISACEN